jgi:hypothetical protein
VTAEFMTENAMHRFSAPSELEEFLMGKGNNLRVFIETLRPRVLVLNQYPA